MSDSPARAPGPLNFSLGTAKPKPHPKARPTNPHKRPGAAALADSDDSDADEDAHRGKIQAVSGFDSKKGGAFDGSSRKPEAKEGPLVIPALKNKDWKKEADRLRGRAHKEIYIPPEAKQAPLKPEDLKEDESSTAGQKFGLQVFAKKETKHEEEEEAPALNAEQTQPKTEDEIAVAALLGAEKTTTSTLVITATKDQNWRDDRGTEDAAYKRDVESRPDVPTLEAYSAVPVEEFGAALLRGMGWKEGQAIGKRNGAGPEKPRLLERRPAFLGIGAKSQDTIPELGAWGRADKKGRNKRVDTAYIPVVMVDRKTGRRVEEGAVLLKEKEDERAVDDVLARRSSPKRHRSKERERDKRRRHDYDGDRRDRDDRHRTSSKRTRSKDRELDRRDRDDRRRRDHDSDREYRHRSSKDKDKRKDRDSRARH